MQQTNGLPRCAIREKREWYWSEWRPRWRGGGRRGGERRRGGGGGGGGCCSGRGGRRAPAGGSPPPPRLSIAAATMLRDAQHLQAAAVELRQFISAVGCLSLHFIRSGGPSERLVVSAVVD